MIWNNLKVLWVKQQKVIFDLIGDLFHTQVPEPNNNNKKEKKKFLNTNSQLNFYTALETIALNPIESLMVTPPNIDFWTLDVDIYQFTARKKQIKVLF